jgi:riboflavin synthase
MFTGIIEEVGKIEKIEKRGHIWTFTVNAPKICKDSKESDSISVDGICLSVTDIKKDTFKVQAVRETLEITTLLSFKENRKVNLERAVQPTDRLGGHILTGHIDGVGKILKKEGKTPFSLTIEPPLLLMEQIVPNGSIGIDGISLTLKEVETSSFKITIIPYTTSFTTIGMKKINDKINIETDILAKYVSKAISKNKKTITMELLKTKGYL